MAVNYRKTPWPWAGGKSDAAPAVWEALGDVDHYVEPFAGSLAVLLRRPHPCNRTYYSETVNDLDGLLCNAWRSIQMSPDAMAEAASWPVCEADMHARHLALLQWRVDRNLELLMADPEWHDPKMAGWWAWGQSAWIGSGWCSGAGPWVVGEDGRITKRLRGSKDDGVHRKIPHMVGDRGAIRPQLREPGVSRQIPYVVDDGRGANRPQLREPGVGRQLPFLSAEGRGTSHPSTWAPGVSRQVPAMVGDRGTNRPQLRDPGVGDFHPMTMPELRKWFEFLSARLRHVRILNGDWSRAVTSGVTRTLSVRNKGHVGIFLDPEYGTAAKCASMYTTSDADLSTRVREWARIRGVDEDTRIVLAGFEGEHESLADDGWRAVEWYRSGFLKGGMKNTSKTSGTQQHRERLWMSPHCLDPATEPQGSLF